MKAREARSIPGAEGRPLKLVWLKEYKYYKKAVLEEIRIKKLRRREKEKLVSEYAPTCKLY